MSFTDIIRAKRDGGRLSSAQIDTFVAGLATDSIEGEAIAALAMAVFLNGMDAEETAALTRAMAQSGAVLDWAAEGLAGPFLDKHSTGGVGDKVSLMLAPIVAACGGSVPMVAGRGLGHTGGTIDKLAAIPGYDAFAGLDRFRAVVRDVGCAIVGQTGELAPADRRLYAVRDVTATIESTPLIVASILSKKLAAGVRGLVMDVKVGSGAFMRDDAAAHDLIAALRATGAVLGLNVRALVTDMDQPLGHAAGNALEVREAIDYLTGARREPRLHAATMALAAEMLVQGGLAPDPRTARDRADAALASGAAAERFARMVAGLGGPADLVERPDHLPVAPVCLPVAAPQAGYLAAINTRRIGEALIDLGAGRRRIDDRIDPAVGFDAVVPLGAEVGGDRPLAIVHAATADAAERAARAYADACRIADTPPPDAPVVRAVFA